MLNRKPIYVEILMKVPMETLWTYTQKPNLHQQWDLRFSEITYIPKSHEEQPQRFVYKTNIGFGLSIAGEGESVGNKERDGIMTSSLKFSSPNPISLILEGAGFWRYVPTVEGVRFLTRYDYRTRFGPFGAWIDRFIFRPIMGWATAWSFDCLRLWLEQGVPPYVLIRRSIIEAVLKISLFFIWMYQGLVPKLLVADSGELDIIQSTPGLADYGRPLLTLMGLGEIGFGLLFLILSGKKRRSLHKINISVLILLGLSAASHPLTYVAPFNPITLNLAMIVLSIISLLNETELPSARRCLRSSREGRDQA
ncbi:DoxX-like family protein [Paenibacillus sp. HWE-109]|uniref:DoxX-like family protein n=1 Tax=Paenibacillus sp. HWE-109 TaxID=1306526 RepID=UPI001EE101B4|nr:DoxX-like family protein [Paenibacillus sp. HWE-109]UKS25347.1 DoxX-like family protein [Paenibacillus sp. HWE-109]